MKMWVMMMIVVWCAAEVRAASEPTIPLLHIAGVVWTDEEIAAIRALHRQGRIRIATKISAAVYQPQPDGAITGFHYNVLAEFAALADVTIALRLVSWNDYFYKAGADVEQVKTDPQYAYVPTLLEEVDLYIDGITVLPWHEKMFDIIKFVPSRQLIVTRKERKPTTIEELNDTTCAMVQDTSMELNLKNIAREKKLHFTYLLTPDFDAMEAMVADGRADFTVYDSDRAFLACYRYPNLTIAMPISEIEIMGWAIHKQNRVLKSVIEKYLQYAQASGILDRYWRAEYGVTFIEYLKIMELR